MTRMIGAAAATVATVLLGFLPAAANDPRLPAHRNVQDLTVAKRSLLDLYLTAREAAAALAQHSDIVLLDVRPAEHIKSAGAPAFPALRVPLIVPNPKAGSKDEPAGHLNPALVTTVRSTLARQGRGQDTTILVLCIAGLHATRAADMLAEAGFSKVYVIVDGFDGGVDDDRSFGGRGWKTEGLAVQQPAGTRSPALVPAVKR